MKILYRYTSPLKWITQIWDIFQAHILQLKCICAFTCWTVPVCWWESHIMSIKEPHTDKHICNNNREQMSVSNPLNLLSPLPSQTQMVKPCPTERRRLAPFFLFLRLHVQLRHTVPKSFFKSYKIYGLKTAAFMHFKPHMRSVKFRQDKSRKCNILCFYKCILCECNNKQRVIK